MAWWYCYDLIGYGKLDHNGAIWYPTVVKNLFHPFFRKKDTSTTCTFFIFNPNLCNVNLYPLSYVQMHHTMWFPEENRSLRFFWTLFQLLHWILLLEVATLSEVILNLFWCGVWWIDDLVGPYLNSPTLLWAGNFTTLDTKNLLRTVMFLWLKQIFMAACLS